MSVKATIGCCRLNVEEKSEIALVLPYFAPSPSQPVFGMRRRLPCSIIDLGNWRDIPSKSHTKPELIAALYTHSRRTVLQHVCLFLLLALWRPLFIFSIVLIGLGDFLLHLVLPHSLKMRFVKQVFSNFDNRHTHRPVPLNLIVKSPWPNQDNSLLRVRLQKPWSLFPIWTRLGARKCVELMSYKKIKMSFAFFPPTPETKRGIKDALMI